MRLFHFSEDPSITVFVPRPPAQRPGVEPLVWTVDEARAWTYLFPRDCPRVLLWPTPGTTAADLERWFGGNADARVACIEWGWLERMHTTALYRYEFEPTGFVPLEDDPWMVVSRLPQRPVAVEHVGDLVQALASHGVELRLMPSLVPLHRAWRHSIHFSGIRLRNANGWPELAPGPPPKVSATPPPTQFC